MAVGRGTGEGMEEASGWPLGTVSLTHLLIGSPVSDCLLLPTRNS